MHDDCFRGAIVLLPIKREDPSSLRFRTVAKSPVQIARSLTATSPLLSRQSSMNPESDKLP